MLLHELDDGYSAELGSKEPMVALHRGFSQFAFEQAPRLSTPRQEEIGFLPVTRPRKVEPPIIVAAFRPQVRPRE